MDRHPQQLKRDRQDKKRRARNIADMSMLRTHIKSVLQSSDKTEAEKLYNGLFNDDSAIIVALLIAS